MNFLLVETDDLTVLGAINAANQSAARQLTPAATSDGRLVLPADVRADCGIGGTWASYADLLNGLSTVDLSRNDFPTLTLGATE